MSDVEMIRESVSLEKRGFMQYRYYVLFVLTLTYAASFMDRQIISILMEDIKAEFVLTDTQLGLLSGLAFALFYSFLGVPIARLADQYSRTKIIAIAVTLWSGVTVLCGAANNFTQLFLARVGVGVGEAGGLAPAHSLISDYFKPGERSLAISIYSLGAVLGMLSGLIMGGYIAEHYGWRYAFVAAGVPGIIIAFLVISSIKEPLRGRMDEGKVDEIPEKERRFVKSIHRLWKIKSYVYACSGHVFGAFFSYAIGSWLPALFMRSYELNQSQVGMVVGVVILAGTIPGMLAGGYLADRLSRNNAKWRGYICMIGVSSCIPFFILAFQADSLYSAVILFSIANFLLTFHHAPSLAVIQIVVNPNERAFAVSILNFVANIIGVAMGPLYVGIVSDAFSARPGGESLSIALMSMMLFLPIAIWSYWKVGRILKES